MQLADRITDLAQRVDRNVPSHSNPEKFHIEKSEIVFRLKRLVKELEDAKGQTPK